MLFLIEPASLIRAKIRTIFLDTVEISFEYDSFKEYCQKTGYYKKNKWGVANMRLDADGLNMKGDIP